MGEIVVRQVIDERLRELLVDFAGTVGVHYGRLCVLIHSSVDLTWSWLKSRD
jgi:hypothetical protein